MGAGARQSHSGQACIGEFFRGRKEICESGLRDDRSSVFPHQPARQSGGASNCDLLTEDGANREFESVPTARDAKARSIDDGVRQQRVVAEMKGNFSRIGSEIKEAANLLDDEKQRCRMWIVDAQGDSRS